MEILYCSFTNIFGIVDADSLVWDDPLYPFMVYGIGVLMCMASCGLCGAVRGEILVSTATPSHVWQRFPKLAAEERNRAWHHSHCLTATPSCGRSTTLSQRVHRNICRFPWSKSLFARNTYNFARLIAHHARRVSIIRNTRRAESPIFLLTHFLCFGITNNRHHVIQKQESDSHLLRR